MTNRLDKKMQKQAFILFFYGHLSDELTSTLTYAIFKLTLFNPEIKLVHSSFANN